MLCETLAETAVTSLRSFTGVGTPVVVVEPLGSCPEPLAPPAGASAVARRRPQEHSQGGVAADRDRLHPRRSKHGHWQVFLHFGAVTQLSVVVFTPRLECPVAQEHDVVAPSDAATATTPLNPFTGTGTVLDGP